MEDEKISLNPGKGEYLFGKFSYKDQTIILIKPLKFMNLSGIPVCNARQFFKVELENLLVVLDDVNLPFGNLRLRESGSDGGHKGLASVIYHLSSEDFPRLRIGIDKARNDLPLSEYVLLNFSTEEREQIPGVINSAVDCIKVWCDEGIEKAMNITNRKVS